MSTGLEVMDSMEALLGGPSRSRLRVGIVLPMTGVIGMAGPSALDAVLLAGHEIDSSRGQFDRPLEFVMVDSGTAPARVAETVSDLARSGTVEAFVALHTSDTLDAVERSLRGQEVPYVFTPGHEAHPRDGAFYCSGEAPDQLGSGLTRVMRGRGVDEWAVVGTDYVWPRAMREAARRIIADNGGRVVYERLMPVGSVRSSVDRMVEEIAASGARGVVINMPGRDLAWTLLAIRAQGLDRRLIRFSGSLEENVLYSVGGDVTGNLYASLHSFDSLQSDRRRELNDRHRVAFGDEAPVLNSWAEHCYDGTHLIARLDRSGLLSASSLGDAGAESTPDAAVALRLAYDMHLAVAEGMTFSVI
jgi:ABC-type branched-subunit amino acid transport system substrate-binding protein